MSFSHNDCYDWQMKGGAGIISLPDFVRWRERDPYFDILLTSGGFDPIHPGHLSVFANMKRIADDLKVTSYDDFYIVALVNSDSFLKAKKGRAFMDIRTRCQILSMVKGVDIVIPFEPSDLKDSTVNEAIKLIRPAFFCKGGDRVGKRSIPEWDTCLEVGAKILTGLGEPKYWSSSDFLKEWANEAIYNWLTLGNNACGSSHGSSKISV